MQQMKSLTLAASVVCLGWTTAAADNWIENGDFEADQPMHWAGGVIERQTVHEGQGALRVDMPAGETSFSSRYGSGIQLDQDEPETLMLAFWMRFDATRQTGPVRGGVTCHVDFDGEPFLAWYGSFQLQPEEAGNWVYREARWKPRAPVVKLRPAVYMKGFEGTVYIDDIYLGPPIDLPQVTRTTMPLAVTGMHGRFTDWPRFRLLSFEPVAHVFHLSAGNQTNLELEGEIDVLRPAPVYLNSAWGSQYWTLYCPERRELAEIYTDERLDLSKTGRTTCTFPMTGFSDHADALSPGSYVFVTDRFKNFLVYSTEKGKGEPYHDIRTGKSFAFWDGVKIERFSKAVGPQGVAAPFSLADLTSYTLVASASSTDGVVRVAPAIRDAGGTLVPLHGLELSVSGAGKTQTAEEEIDDDGVPTGAYLLAGPMATKRIRVTGTVRVAAPQGLTEARLEADVDVLPVAGKPLKLQPLQLAGWGGGHYSLAHGAANGQASVRNLVADARAAGVSRLIVVVRSSTAMRYPSEVALGAQPEWDLAACAVQEGKRFGVDIFAGYILGIAQPIDLEKRPEWAMLDRSGKQTGWYCYSNPEVRAYHARQLAEIVSNYEVAGVSLDFCRPGSGCHCKRCASLFGTTYGKKLEDVEAYDPDWVAFKRQSTTTYMRELSAALRAARATAQFSGYVWGRLGPDKDRAGQDWPSWLRDGVMDWVCVGQYTVSTPMFRSQCHTLKRIADEALAGDTSRICPLLGVSYVQDALPSYALADAGLRRHLRAAQTEGMLAAGYFPFWAVRTHLPTSCLFTADRP